MDMEEEIVGGQKKRITVLSSEEEEEMDETFYGNSHSIQQATPLITSPDNENVSEAEEIPLVAPPQETALETEHISSTELSITAPSTYDTNCMF